MTQNTSRPAVSRSDIADMYPLSPMQEGILFHSVSAPEAGLYMPQTAIRLSGPVDSQALRAAWQAAVNRHPVLRSAFYWEERDQPFQIVFRSATLPWTELDWSDSDGDDYQTRLAALLADNRQRPFDLKRPPLLRIQFIRTGAERSVLVVCFHHIILDGWSVRQLLEDALALYLTETGRNVLPLPPARPYSNYIGWLKKRDRAASGRFWQQYLAGFAGPTRLLQGDSTDNFERGQWQVPADIRLALRDFCARHSLTLNTVLQGALGLLIARQTGRNDVVFGTTTSGRPGDLPGATAMVGLFINTLPVRVTIDAGQTLEAWLRDLQARQAATTDHDYLPLRQIQGSGASLFDTLLVVENFSTPAKNERHLPFRVEGSDFDERTHFPLTIWVVPGEDDLFFHAGYSSDTVKSASIAALMQRFIGTLGDMARSAPGQAALSPECVAPLPEDAGFANPASFIPAKAPAIAAPSALTTPTQHLLASVWAEVLHCGPLDGAANFFDLGGHSLLAARVISRLRRELSVDIPVRSLFERPVLSDLAAFIDATRGDVSIPEGHVEIEI